MTSARERARATIADPAWRLARLYYIVNKQAERVLLRPNAIQARLNAETARRKIVLKARQFGVSTNELVKMLDHAIWNRNQTCCILSHEQDSIEKLFRIVRRAYDFMDARFKPRLDRGGGSKYELFFPGVNSRIYCDLESRSDTIQWLHVSEAAFMKDPKRMLATMQTVPMDTGRVTIETTPNGIGNHFYDLWTAKDPTYARLFYPWFLFPDYAIPTGKLKPTVEERALIVKAAKHYGVKITHEQLAFRRAKKIELKGLFVQEYPEDDLSCFLASGGSAMDLMKIKAMFDAAPEPLATEELNGGTLRIYAEPGSGPYAIGADTAEGVRKDFSVGCLFDVRTLEQVAVLSGNCWKPSEFAEHLYALAMRYHRGGGYHPLLGVERNNHGHSVLQHLDEQLRYPNLYKVRMTLGEDRLGWLTDRVTRPIMLDAWVDAVENETAVIRDRATLAECLTLVDNEGKIEAADGKFDDHVIAGAIGLQLAIEEHRTVAVYSDIGSRIRV